LSGSSIDISVHEEMLEKRLEEISEDILEDTLDEIKRNSVVKFVVCF